MKNKKMFKKVVKDSNRYPPSTTVHRKKELKSAIGEYKDKVSYRDENSLER